mmetsp:Transcript_9926/g.30092  ORF Transcript_9926/g.30092 Transcript_9926/m.30092 type:complete len:283 (-) Transcript_9926:286-1134(-)
MPRVPGVSALRVAQVPGVSKLHGGLVVEGVSDARLVFRRRGKANEEALARHGLRLRLPDLRNGALPDAKGGRHHGHVDAPANARPDDAVGAKTRPQRLLAVLHVRRGHDGSRRSGRKAARVGDEVHAAGQEFRLVHRQAQRHSHERPFDRGPGIRLRDRQGHHRRLRHHRHLLAEARRRKVQESLGRRLRRLRTQVRQRQSGLRGRLSREVPHSHVRLRRRRPRPRETVGLRRKRRRQVHSAGVLNGKFRHRLGRELHAGPRPLLRRRESPHRLCPGQLQLQ